MNPNGGDTGMADSGDDVRDPELADRVEEIADSLEHGYDDYAVTVLRAAASRLRGGEGEQCICGDMYHWEHSGEKADVACPVHDAAPDAAPDTEGWELNPTCICGHSLAEHHWDEAGCEVCDCREFEHYRVTPSTQEEPHWRAYDEMTDAERRRNRQELSQEGQGRDKWYKRYVTDPEFHAWVDRVVNRACELERDRLRGAPEGAGTSETTTDAEPDTGHVGRPDLEHVAYRYRPPASLSVNLGGGNAWHYAEALEADDMEKLADKGWQVERLYRRADPATERERDTA